MTEKPCIQASLYFFDIVKLIQQKNVVFYENISSTTKETVKVLYHKFLNENPGIKILCGTFFALKPLHVRPATTKDLEMRCCKKYLHARWIIKSMIENCEKQMIDLGHINDYYTFFEQVTQHCKKEEHTKITWDCTPNKKSCCNHILMELHNLKTSIPQQDDKSTEVSMQHFEKVEVLIKNRKIVKHLKAVSTKANFSFITEFLEKIPSSIIHHRNKLKDYRSRLRLSTENIIGAYIDVNFSENLSVPVKYESQDLHW